MSLPALLRDLAEEARMYADPDRAIGAARRHRRVRGVVGSLCALIAVTLLFAVASGAGTDSKVPPIAVPTDGVPAELRAVYPPRVTAQRAPDMPLDTRLGLAAFFYAPCPRLPDCWPSLALSDGRTLAVPMTIDSLHPRDLSLSPNGRYAGWGYQVDSWYWVTDLQTGRRRTVGDQSIGTPISAWYWSPDSRWLLLAEHTDGVVSRYLLADMAGDVRELPPSIDGPGNSVAGLLNDGRLLLSDASGLRIVDGLTGRELRALPAPDLGGAEKIIGWLVSPCGCTAYARLFGNTEDGTATGLLGVDLDDGHVLGRLDLPVSSSHGGAEPGVWFAQSAPPEGIVLVRYHPNGTDVEIMNDVNGSRTRVSQLPANSYVLVRGEGR